MDRQIVYPGQIPLETDLLNTNKFAMIGLAKLAAAILGQNTCLFGLACTPSMPASMTVNVGEGQIYSLQNIDGAAYSSLPADTTHSIVKQGLLMAPMALTLKAPVNSGQSINYLIQVAYSDVDSGPTVLPYYNATNPAIAYSGPENTGTAQSTIRSGACHVTLKAGIAAVKGSQVTPSPDAGYISAWVITVHYGDHVIDADAIRQADGAPFLPADGLISAIQQGRLNYGEDTGTINHYQVSCQPAVSHLSDGMRLHFRAKNTNTGPSWFTASHLPEASIFTAEHEDVKAGHIIQGEIVDVEWHSALGAWIICSSPSCYNRDESDARYLSLKGGEIDGDLEINGKLIAAKKLFVGKAELTEQGDLVGGLWGGSLEKWLERFMPVIAGDANVWYYKSADKKFIIQGGKIARSRTTTQVKFPIAFPSNCLNVQFSLNKIHKKSVENPHVSLIEKSHFELKAASGEAGFYWVAFGH